MFEATEQEIKVLKNVCGMSTRDAIVFVYNNAIDDAVNALGVYADKNPQHTTGLRAVARELERNFKLRTP
jgi:hypothetical protein